MDGREGHVEFDRTRRPTIRGSRPGTHALTADEVRRWRLHEAPGGYDMSQVDDLLDQIIVTLDGKD